MNKLPSVWRWSSAASRAAVLLFAVSLPAASAAIEVSPATASGEPGKFAASEIRREAGAKGLTQGGVGKETRVVLTVGRGVGGVGQSYRIRVRSEGDRRTITVDGADPAGAMYGGLDIAEAIRIGTLDTLPDSDHQPHLALRGIKFNAPLDERTPTYESNKGDSEFGNVLTMWDLNFWKAHLDDLARFRYNCFSLWNLHPFPSMVRVPGYEDAALADVVSTQGRLKLSMDEKIAFWREVMRYAKDRNVAFYIVTWNIFVPAPDDIRAEQGLYGMTPKHDDPRTTEYYRKSVTQLLLTYPDLAGIGLTVGERMPGLTPAQKEQWAVSTFGQGVLAVATGQPARKISLIHRAHQTQPKEVVDMFKAVVSQPNVDFLFSFKYAQAHVFSSTRQTFADRFIKQLGELKTLWTLRNDDNFYFRWGAPDFVREFIRNLPPKVTAGFYYGSDSWVWGREFLSLDPETPRQPELAKHWYHWMLWGRLGYDPDLSNEQLKKILAARYREVPAHDLFAAWQEASMIYPITTGFHWGSLDFKWYIEGCRSIPKQAETESGFHDVERFITLETHPGTDNIAIPKYVEGVAAGQVPKGTIPVQVSEQLHARADRALKILDGFPPPTDKELRLTLGDIRAMSHLGKYYGYKIRGATELALFRRTNDRDRQQAAIRELTDAARHWERYVAAARAQYLNPIRLNRTGVCDWQALTTEVWHDVEIARGAARR
jgi:hypothetical protein